MPDTSCQMRRSITVILIGCLVAAPALGQSTGLKASALKQVKALVVEKRSWTRTERKISSRLLMEIKQRRNKDLRQALPELRTRIEVAPDDTVEVDIQAEVSDALLNRIRGVGGRIINQHPGFGAIRAAVPIDRLDEIAARPSVRHIRPAERPILRKINTSEGDVAHRADTTRSALGVQGTGVKACVLSDSVDALDSLQGSGDLPAVDVLDGQSGNPGTSEGTALLEIVYDLAPGATLGYATAFGGQAQFAQNILDLAADGCDVIVDDVFYFAEPVFQDGIIAQAVDTVVAQGALYFSSAGNAGNLNDGTSGVWEGPYNGTTLPGSLTGEGFQSAHDFGGGSNSNQITDDPPFAITLHWNDPLGGSGNDYDLIIMDAALENIRTFSADFQNGDDDPYEGVNMSSENDVGKRIVVTLFTGDSDKIIHVNTLRGELEHATDGQIGGHTGANGAFAVAAVNVASAGGGAFTGGGSNPVEIFSSDGPRQVFFEADGSPIEEVRQKPDIAAADGVSTATPGFNPFFGTSAAAPHAAAIAALIRELFPEISYRGMRRLVYASALDIESSGVDRDAGAGILDAQATLNAMISANGFESPGAPQFTPGP